MESDFVYGKPIGRTIIVVNLFNDEISQHFYSKKNTVTLWSAKLIDEDDLLCSIIAFEAHTARYDFDFSDLNFLYLTYDQSAELLMEQE